jgi:outer membrane receptor protein involved in Fe transport
LIDTYASYFHLPIYRTPQNVNTDFSSIIPGIGSQLIEGAPQITISQLQKVSESGSKDLEQVIQANTAVTKVLSKHTIKTGFGYLYDNHWNDSASSPQRGGFSYNGQYSGNAFADFLLGYPNQTVKPIPNNYIVKNLSSQYALYVQDDWKPLKNLTVNAGLRYDLQWFESNPYGQNSLYVPSLQKVVVFGTSYPANAIPGLATTYPVTLSSQVGLPNTVFGYLGQAKTNFAPRLGFAYEVVPNTVLRGAYGIYFPTQAPLLPTLRPPLRARPPLPTRKSTTWPSSTSSPTGSIFGLATSDSTI